MNHLMSCAAADASGDGGGIANDHSSRQLCPPIACFAGDCCCIPM
jgi:hypothetical protein